jgi:protein-S-isoprenylcysteine O-methyltransferase Ste14
MQIDPNFFRDIKVTAVEVVVLIGFLSVLFKRFFEELRQANLISTALLVSCLVLVVLGIRIWLSQGR